MASNTLVEPVGLAASRPVYSRAQACVVAACGELLADGTAASREALMQRIGKLRRSDDREQLLEVVYQVMSRVHGASVAGERVVALGLCLEKTS